MKIQLNRNPQLEKLPPSTLYVSQDNYEVVTFPSTQKWKYLYCDSATSCIIIIVTGKNKSGGTSVAISHLSRPERFETFWGIIEKTFVDGISIFAHGANPPQPGKNNDGTSDYTALRNANIVNNWVLKHSINQPAVLSPKIKQATLIFGEGNPSLYDNNLDCYGIDVSNPAQLIVSNSRFYLTSQDRDPSGGLQTLFCPFGLKLNPQIVLVQASRAFSTDPFSNSLSVNKTRLVNIAHQNNYERYENMSDEEILKNCSSTPDAEVPWFCDTIREAAKYVRLNYKS